MGHSIPYLLEIGGILGFKNLFSHNISHKLGLTLDLSPSFICTMVSLMWTWFCGLLAHSESLIVRIEF